MIGNWAVVAYFKVKIRHCSGKAEEELGKMSGETETGLKSEPGTFRIRIWNISTTPNSHSEDKPNH
jgi:hypothetical protein